MRVPVTELRPGMVLNGGRVVVWAFPAVAGDGETWGVVTTPGGYVAHSQHTVFDVLGPVP